MKIICISSKDSGYDVIDPLKDLLEKEITNTNVELIYVHRHLDIPAKLMEIKDADLIFVFVGYEELDLAIKTTMEKIVDVDMKSKIPIVKAFEEVVFAQEEGGQETQEKLAAKWKQEIIDYLFHPDKMKPGGSA